jgi:hypothetical protein
MENFKKNVEEFLNKCPIAVLKFKLIFTFEIEPNFKAQELQCFKIKKIYLPRSANEYSFQAIFESVEYEEIYRAALWMYAFRNNEIKIAGEQLKCFFDYSALKRNIAIFPWYFHVEFNFCEFDYNVDDLPTKFQFINSSIGQRHYLSFENNIIKHRLDFLYHHDDKKNLEKKFTTLEKEFKIDNNSFQICVFDNWNKPIEHEWYKFFSINNFFLIYSSLKNLKQ